MRNLIKIILFITLVPSLIITTVLVSNKQFMKWLIQTYNYEVLGNYDHYLTCEELPTIEEARNILLKYPDMKEQIEKVSTGNVVLSST